MSRSKRILQPDTNLKNITLVPPKAKTTEPQTRPKSKVKVEVSTENKSCSAIQVDPKNVLEPHTIPKSSPLGPQKA